MGVYIPNMEKPKSCKECLFEQAHYVNNYSRRSYCVLGAEQEHCPLIEITEPRVGKWIDHKEIIYTDPEVWGYSQECSLCGFTLGAKEYNYCPYCGAKMEESR